MRVTIPLKRVIMDGLRTLQLKQDALKIFRSGLDAVLPVEAVANYLKLKGNVLEVQNKQYYLNRNVYLIGFGKAVARMAEKVADILNHHLIAGIISVPEGTSALNNYPTKRGVFSLINEKVRVMEGAKDNLPDENSHKAAQEITKFASQCPSDSLLIVLVSGGGSALLPLPIPPVTLPEKQTLTKLLSKSGADIHELNTIRKSLSLVKGGGIARLSSSSKIIALILSDVIGDHLDIIASGPTVEDTASRAAPVQILQKYNLLDHTPENILKVLKKKSNLLESDYSRVQNVLIGSNKLALKAAAEQSCKLGYTNFVLTTAMHGESRHCGEVLALLASALHRAVDTNNANLQTMCNNVGIPVENVDRVMTQARAAAQSGNCLCVLSGGETTVTVRGRGVGGRNQELALSFAVKLNEIFEAQQPEILLLSAGTDGFDGPNDAAGAFGFSSLKTEAEAVGLRADTYLQNNDSYHFYQEFAEGRYHIVTGHTGTNVMDIQILLVRVKTPDNNAYAKTS